MRHESIRILYPAVLTIDDGLGCFDSDGHKIDIDESLVQAKIVELQAAEPMRLLKKERNQRIAATDWRFLSDQTPSQEWIDYRQALRDLPANSTPELNEDGNLINVNWPVEPTE